MKVTGRPVAIMLLAFLWTTVVIGQTLISASQTYKPFEHFQDCDVCSEMIVLPPGKYMMGATAQEFLGATGYQSSYSYESPQHPVNVKSFAIAKFNVTRRQFSIFAKETGFIGKGCKIFNGHNWIVNSDADWQNPGFRQTDQDPVICISWDDTQKFIAWLN